MCRRRTSYDQPAVHLVVQRKKRLNAIVVHVIKNERIINPYIIFVNNAENSDGRSIYFRSSFYFDQAYLTDPRMPIVWKN